MTGVLLLFATITFFFASCEKDNVGDGTIPVITIVGLNPLYWALDFPYEDAGATAYDITSDGDTIDISSRIQVNSNVDVTNVGDYEVKYNVTDESGVSAEEKIRKVTVVLGK